MAREPATHRLAQTTPPATRVRGAAVLAFLLAGACHVSTEGNFPDDSTPIAGGVAPKLVLVGQGPVTTRYTGEVWVHGNTAYTSTWGTRGTTPGNAVLIWDVTARPLLVDSVIVPLAGTTGDVQVSDDGKLLAVAIEPRPNGGLALYSLTDPRKPQLLTRYSLPNVANGVHTAEIARVNGTLYAFCSIDPSNLVSAKLVILNLTDPSNPVESAVLTIGSPTIHDVFVRNGLLFTAEWNDGLGIWDIGAMGGTPAQPRRLGRVATLGGKVHNVYWFNDPANGAKRYAFVGEEGPGSIGSSSIGDIHVVDVSNFAAPVEVGRYTVTGAGVHNFSMDEERGLLYAAYYNGGIRVLDVRGDLSTCTSDQKASDGRCELGRMGRVKAFLQAEPDGVAYVWGVHFSGGALYASDMLNGLWKFASP
ncbi:MAG: hypothetical protein H7Z40_23695 [Phycisphaerae bacterium]|nr:hypothetical protein [Gemmatimonadaceae bacterium]